jgi:hypothetical protein
MRQTFGAFELRWSVGPTLRGALRFFSTNTLAPEPMQPAANQDGNYIPQFSFKASPDPALMLLDHKLLDRAEDFVLIP